MAAKLTVWESAPPPESVLRDAFRAEGLSPYAWSNGPGDGYGVHTHTYDKVLYCARGSITFQVEGADVTMKPGDRLVGVALAGPLGAAPRPPAPATGPVTQAGGASVPGQLLVGYRPGVSEAARTAMDRRHGARVLERFPEIDVELVALPTGTTP